MKNLDVISRSPDVVTQYHGSRTASLSRYFVWSVPIVFCVFFAVGCQQGEAPLPPKVQAQAAKEAPKPAMSASAVNAADEKKEEAPDAAKLKNPFKPYIVKIDRRAVVVAHTTPLQKYEIEHLRLVAVMWGADGAYAMVEAPDGKGFSIRKGDLIGNRNGKVRKIDKDKVVVEELFTVAGGEATISEFVMKMPLSKGEEELR